MSNPNKTHVEDEHEFIKNFEYLLYQHRVIQEQEESIRLIWIKAYNTGSVAGYNDGFTKGYEQGLKQ